jgi:hypothetical protein
MKLPNSPSSHTERCGHPGCGFYLFVVNGKKPMMPKRCPGDHSSSSTQPSSDPPPRKAA